MTEKKCRGGTNGGRGYFLCNRTVLDYAKLFHFHLVYFFMHTYSICIHTVYAYIQYMHTYSICIHTVYAYIQYMHTYSICIHTVYAYIQYMHTYSICIHTVYAYIQYMGDWKERRMQQTKILDHNFVDHFLNLPMW